MGKGGKGKGKGGYPWWEHIKPKDGDANGNGHAEPYKASKPLVTKGQNELEEFCIGLEGYQYPRYKDLTGTWDVDKGNITVFVDRVQGDAYAPPSSVRCRLSQQYSQFNVELANDKMKNRAASDFVARVLNDYLTGGSGTDWTAKVKGAGWGASKGGDIQIDNPSQFVLQRTSVVIKPTYIEARVTLAMPAHGRTIEGYKAATAFRALVEACDKALNITYYKKTELFQKLVAHGKCVQDQVKLRSLLAEAGLVAFVGNGSILPRISGVDDRPMQGNVVKFQSPPSLEVEFQLPNAGIVKGMGIKKGISLIIGGGFHGKSTLLQALQYGVYDKVPGDGREFVVTDELASKIRAEDGRSVKCTDISPFIKNLPFDLDTTKFSTADASGSTSQAANISEALEAGATTLLVDEDTCATNFMIRDEKMKMLVAREKEPITPFMEKILPLYRKQDVSTVLVVGGSGDFFEVADTVICMEDYKPTDMTSQAKDILKQFPPSHYQSDANFTTRSRTLLKEGLEAGGKTSAKSLRCISYGEQEVELTFVEQLVEISQAKALCDMLNYMSNDGSLKNGKLFREVLVELDEALDKDLDVLSRNTPNGFYAKPRILELAACINRLRSAKFC